MSDPSVLRHLCASEFPNDNPLLHDGAIWVCFAPCGPLRPVVRPRSGSRSTTIPAGVAHPTVTEVTSLAEPSEHAELSAPPTDEVDLKPADSLQVVHPEPREGDPEEAAAPEGCSLSAGLEPVAAPAEEIKVSEMRERPAASNDTAEAAAPVDVVEPSVALQEALREEAEIARAPVDVECAPSSPETEAVQAAPLVEDPEARHTMLPPPSEDGRTLTLKKIHVSGRAKEVRKTEAVPAVAEAPSAANESGGAAEPAAARPDPFAAFAAALVEVALAAGATRAAALLPGFLDGAAQDFSGFSDAARTAMLESGLLCETNGSFQPSAAFSTTASAWRMVLRGESNDFSACGTSTLDGWAGDLLKSFGIGRDGRVDVKRELRRRGVAAFGMILAA